MENVIMLRDNDSGKPYAILTTKHSTKEMEDIIDGIKDGGDWDMEDIYAALQDGEHAEVNVIQDIDTIEI